MYVTNLVMLWRKALLERKFDLAGFMCNLLRKIAFLLDQNSFWQPTIVVKLLHYILSLHTKAK
jgi:hypothetical protein